ncbi:hypothetical protein H0A61_01452 [Koleobacter methoxysyntrophicus]|uniref:TATA-box binding protein n=1 Tax=Koleobacter methoxysyntrophicus TaxID=2751313 RepID=A0A8A0RLG7_9FIRM|nr:YwmB family TATA-box binding protein [Koleobacter methoxysyntrophicus]QSQ09093.1 hypothetical protein H0A61_01452 [Koleobacter methoxysyntrophicus]
MINNFRVILILIISLMSTQVMGAGVEVPYKNPLIDAFQATGCSVVETSVNTWSCIGNNYLSIEDLEKKTLEAAEIIGLSGEKLKFLKESDSEHRLIKIEGFLQEDVYVEIYLQSVRFPEELGIKPETYIVINAIQKADYSAVEELKKKFGAALKKLGGYGQIYYCITGTKNGKLEKDEIENSIIGAFKAISAQPVEGIADSILLSIYGYSAIIKDSITVMGQRINLNIAARYNEHDDRTYFWVGSPIISVEY